MRRRPEEGKRSVLGNAVGRAVGVAGKVVGARLRLPGFRRSRVRVKMPDPGAAPGIDEMPGIDTPPPPETVLIQCFDYSPERIHVQEVDDLEAFLDEPRPAWATVRWINVDSLNPYVVNQLRERYQFHTLSAEDVLRTPQRPKLELYDDYMFIVAEMVTLIDDQIVAEQISFFAYSDTLLTFQERPGDLWDPIRSRIRKAETRHRRHSVGYLLYTLIDALVDNCFPILEHYGDVFEEMEAIVARDPTPEVLSRIHAIRRELTLLRRVLWPMRELLDKLCRDEEDRLSDNAKTFLRDVYDHTIQIVDIVETYREMASVHTDLYISSVSNRLNEVMKVLTLIATFFIPMTFLTGVYGMNFRYMPERDWEYSYLVFWLLCAALTGGLSFYFWKKRWIGRR